MLTKARPRGVPVPVPVPIPVPVPDAFPVPANRCCLEEGEVDEADAEEAVTGMRVTERETGVAKSA